MIMIENLYEKIIKNNLESSNILKVITGYSSSKFIKKILKDSPKINIIVYIGMSQFGIIKSQYDGLKNISNKYKDRLKVYLQIEGKNTHIKLYSWYNNNHYLGSYVGSANFSYNGFFNFRELMINTNKNVEKIFSIQDSMSKNILDDDIIDRINIIDDNYFKFVYNNGLNPNNSIIKSKNNITKSHRSVSYGYQEIEENEILIPIFLDNDNEKDIGINAWKRGQSVYLTETTNRRFYKFFSTDKELFFITDDKKLLKGRLKKHNSSQLEIDNLYEYLANRLSVKDKKSITSKDLENYGRDEILITKMDENNYYFDFNNYRVGF